MVFELEEVCINFLMENFFFENVFDILLFVKKFEEKEFVVCCWEVVDLSVQEVIKFEIFVCINKDFFQEVVKWDDFVIYEIEFFEVVD